MWLWKHWNNRENHHTHTWPPAHRYPGEAHHPSTRDGPYPQWCWKRFGMFLDPRHWIQQLALHFSLRWENSKSGVVSTRWERGKSRPACQLLPIPTSNCEFIFQPLASRILILPQFIRPNCKVFSNRLKKMDKRDYVAVPGYWLGAVIPILFIII